MDGDAYGDFALYGFSADETLRIAAQYRGDGTGAFLEDCLATLDSHGACAFGDINGDSLTDISRCWTCGYCESEHAVYLQP